MPRKKVVHTKDCKACGRKFTATDSRRKYCDQCRKADKHRNRTRRKPYMFVSVDGEALQKVRTDYNAGSMRLGSLSYGREDGSSGTLWGSPKEILSQLVDVLHDRQTYDTPDGKFKQAVVAFHFNWDAAVISKEFTPHDAPKYNYQIIRKVQSKIKTSLCGADHDPADCPRWHDHDEMDRKEANDLGIEVDEEWEGLMHRWNPDDMNIIIGEGGETDLIVWDRSSKLAIAATPKRRFYIEHRPHGDRYEEWRRVDIHDTGTAFVGGLLSVIDAWNPELTQEQKDIIEWGKKARTTHFENAPEDKIAAYSEAECVAHARVCRKLVETVSAAAHVVLHENKLFGSGSIAQAALRHYGVPKREESDLGEEWKALYTYFGGKIETPVIGLIPGLVDEEDINSAYPAKMINIPCMRGGHGHWVTRKRGVRDVLSRTTAVVGHVLVSWDFTGTSTSTLPFMVRARNSNVYTPYRQRRTWVTLAEYRAALEKFGNNIIEHECYYWEPDCDCEEPFGFLADLYKKRLEIKEKQGAVEKFSREWWELQVQQLAIKLVINSIYGKLAQRRPQVGSYTNLHLASYITGATRAQVNQRAWEVEDAGGTVVYQHTDSVLSIGAEPLDEGSALGAWGMEKPTEDLVIVQPGLATSISGTGKTASRGVKADVFIEAVIDYASKVDFTQHPRNWPPLVVEQTQMISRRMAMARGEPETAGNFETTTMTINLMPRKRDGERAEQIPTMPTAWKVPPIETVLEPATLESIKVYQSQLEKRRKAGMFD